MLCDIRSVDKPRSCGHHHDMAGDRGTPEWELLGTSNNTAEILLVRAELEARGIPVRVEGEHTHGVLGAFHGSVVMPRIFVPKRALRDAQALVEPVLGPFANPHDDEQDVPVGSPFRSQAEQDDDDGDTVAPLGRRKQYGVILILTWMILPPWFGLNHLYARKHNRALALFALSVMGFGAGTNGMWWGGVIFALVWPADVIGGSIAVALHNRALAVAEEALTDD